MKQLILAYLCFVALYCKAQVIAYPTANISQVQLSACTDLHYVTPEVIGHQLNVSVTYYETLLDAQNETNPLNRFFTPTSDPQTIYARVDSDITSDFAIEESILDPDYYTGGPPPPGISPCYFDVCDSDNNGSEIVNLDNLRCLYNGYGFPNTAFCSSNENDVETTYYLTQADADNETNPISVNYSVTATTTIYRKIKNTVTGVNQVDDLLNLSFITSCTLDTDNDGIIDVREDVNNNLIKTDDDTDQDGLKNYQDPDDDGDGILTIDEDYNNNGDPTDDDTNANGIPDYLEDTVTLSVDKHNRNTYKVYPKPVKNAITVTSKNSIKSLELYNYLGSQLLKTNATTIDVKAYQSGLYFLKIEFENNSQSIEKIIIE